MLQLTAWQAVANADSADATAPTCTSSWCACYLASYLQLVFAAKQAGLARQDLRNTKLALVLAYRRVTTVIIALVMNAMIVTITVVVTIVVLLLLW